MLTGSTQVGTCLVRMRTSRTGSLNVAVFEEFVDAEIGKRILLPGTAVLQRFKVMYVYDIAIVFGTMMQTDSSIN